MATRGGATRGGATRGGGGKERTWVGDVLTLVLLFGLLLAVYLLPPDTSLAEVDRSGVLRVCVPPDYPPLVATDQERPGLDVELVREIARRMGVRLALNVNSSIGRDFNPRNWGVTRAQCQVLAGGVVVSLTTRSFLDTTPPHLETGWAMVSAGDVASLQGARVGVYAGLSGLDRLGLSSFLRAEGATLEVVDSATALAEGIASGRLHAGISEALTARQIAGANDWTIKWLPPPIERYPLAFGLWKGDLTLKRKLAAILADLEREGFLAALAEKYDIAPIGDTFVPASPAPRTPAA
jgi:polar amino acid transport system substrate-binding protein/cystine transport system substrate-binding protein/membrane-bound lytic murein transglycosylase F